MDRKSRTVKSGSLKKKFARHTKELLELILTGTDDKFNDREKALFDDLDSNVSSSWLLEAINSVIRTMLNSRCGQITQCTLNMIAFFMNHDKIFAADSPEVRRMNG